MTALPDYVSFKHLEGSPLRDLFPAASDDLLQLLTSLLTINPSKRCNCTEALRMSYFSNRPAPTPGPMLPLPPSIRSRKEEEKPSLKRKIMEESGFGVYMDLRVDGKDKNGDICMAEVGLRNSSLCKGLLSTLLLFNSGRQNF
ncbi:Cyclin-dependent kinase 7 [Chionoecetes opilio]|uniref:Cyclin-dependent kinase 7 n=1 Tax=Chionoecetes opilio TaxID=41210 RepID=A0A8J4Y8C9_CHIOP|nr:Cyclin-dependent kinase 7 [Chionoecetes opilio]